MRQEPETLNLFKDGLVLGKLLKSVEPLIKKVGSCYFRNHGDLEDFVQDVHERIIANIDHFNDGDGSNFKSWVMRIAYNRAISMMRRRYCEKKTTDFTSVDSTKPEPDPERLTATREIIDKVSGFVSHQNMLCLLLFLAGYKIHEISAMLGIKNNTTKARIWRARKRIKTLVPRPQKGGIFN